MTTKFIIYNDGTKNLEFEKLLKERIKQSACFEVTVVNNTFHSLDRKTERHLSDEQWDVLAAIGRDKDFVFNACDVSEIRGVTVNNQFYITGLVINDVVFAVHSKGLPKEIIKLGYGTAEGEGFAVIKTVLKYANKQPACHVSHVDGYRIIKDEEIHDFVFRNKKNR